MTRSSGSPDADFPPEAVDAASSDVKSLREAYMRYRALLVRYLRRRSGNLSDAEDIAQDVFLRVYNCRTADGDVDNPKAYVFRTANNLLADLRRQRAVRRAYQESLPEDGPSPATPERVLLDSSQLDAVRKAIMGLPPRSREIFILHRFHGWSHKAIAAHLEISVNAVEKNVIRALKRCRQSVEDSSASPSEEGGAP